MGACGPNTCPAQQHGRGQPPGGHPVQGSDMATVQAWANGGLVTGAALFTAVFRQPQEPLSGLEFSGPGYKAALFVPR